MKHLVPIRFHELFKEGDMSDHLRDESNASITQSSLLFSR